jgi:predicted flap endonuclease-1-like 5' DNA nuclease
VYLAPRKVVGSIKGIEVVEMQRSGTTGMCCGAGGARMWMEESIGTKVNDERALEAISTGASRVATACPFCYIMLDDGVKGAGFEDDQVKVADLSIHLLDAIEAGERTLAMPDAPLFVPGHPSGDARAAGEPATNADGAEPAEATVQGFASVAVATEPDNLKLLVGIGPALEQILNEAGITTYAQLASATVQQLQDILPDLHDSRVEREDWIGQAQRFAAAKALGEDLEALARDDQAR